MTAQTFNPLEDLLVKNLAKETVLAVEEAFDAGSRDAYRLASEMHLGHKAHALGTLRHYRMNETFARALESTGCSPSPINSNSLVVGRSGIFQIARLNLRIGPWFHMRRSRQRRMLAAINSAIEPLVQLDLFEGTPVAEKATVFFIAIFPNSLDQSHAPISTVVAVPNASLKSWLYFKPLQEFLEAYNRPSPQQDKAVPTLKKNVMRKSGTEG